MAITIDQWADQIELMVRTGALQKSLTTAAATIAMEGQRHMAFGVTNVAGGLRVRTGALRRSLAGTSKRTKTGAVVRLTTGGRDGAGGVPYAAIHEQDGKWGSTRTIHAKAGGFLRFPVGPDAFTGAGVARGTSSAWAVVKSVKIPARPYMQPALEHIAKKANVIISDQIARTLEGGK
jgi:phage gpG-like protein